jgi:alpha-beta hydrolase superfamily lysophospholipase
MNELLPTSSHPGWEGTTLYVGLTPHTVLCHLHQPDTSSRRSTAVLFCPPFGWDEMTSYRARRNWAQRLAQAGYPAVRFDLPTTGDSGGGPREPARVALWVDATAQMVAWVRERTGAQRIALVGLGLGGLLAWQAAADGADVQDLLLWGVPASGRAMLREHRAYAQVIAAGAVGEDQPTVTGEQEDEELVGYMLTANAEAELRALKPTQQQPPRPLERVLLFGRDDVPVPAAQEEYFARAASVVETEATADYDSLFALPAHARTPWTTIERTIVWLEAGERNGDQGGAAHAQAVGTPGRGPQQFESVEFEHEGSRLREEPVELELGGYRISGILTTPLDASPANATALLLSAGALRRTGLSRTWVEIARRWAGRGVASLRFDQPGIGDSTGDETQLVSDRVLYDPAETQIVLGAMDWLARRGLPERYVAVGSCSGAYWSLQAALADQRVVATLMIGLYAVQWSEQLVAERATAQAFSALRSRFWKRLANGSISAGELRRKLQELSPRRVGGRLAGSGEGQEAEHLKTALEALRDRRTEALFVLFEGQPMLRQLVRGGYLAQLEQWPNVMVERVLSPDNLFRGLPLQQQVHASVDKALDRVVGADHPARLLPAP